MTLDMLKPTDYPALEALTKIAQAGSFDRAAMALGITAGAISQRISGFEDRLGAVLVRRAPNTALTPLGDRLVRHFNEVRALEAGLQDLLGPVSERPTLRIAINADSLASWALPAFAQVKDVLFDFEIDDQDHSDTWLRDGAVAAAITSRKSPVRGCDVIPLGYLPYTAVATPAFAAEYFPDGLTRDAVETAPALIFNRKDTLQHRWAARYCGPNPTLAMHFLPSTADISEAARLGIGWGLNPTSVFVDDIAANRLIALDETPLLVPLYLQVARISAKPMDRITQALRHRARESLTPME